VRFHMLVLLRSSGYFQIRIAQFCRSSAPVSPPSLIEINSCKARFLYSDLPLPHTWTVFSLDVFSFKYHFVIVFPKDMSNFSWTLKYNYVFRGVNKEIDRKIRTKLEKQHFRPASGYFRRVIHKRNSGSRCKTFEISLQPLNPY
jgi:hypothetical protein